MRRLCLSFHGSEARLHLLGTGRLDEQGGSLRRFSLTVTDSEPDLLRVATDAAERWVSWSEGVGIVERSHEGDLALLAHKQAAGLDLSLIPCGPSPATDDGSLYIGEIPQRELARLARLQALWQAGVRPLAEVLLFDAAGISPEEVHSLGHEPDQRASLRALAGLVADDSRRVPHNDADHYEVKLVR